MASKSKNSKADDSKKRIKIADFKSIVWVLNNLNDDEIAAMDMLPFDGEKFAEFVELCVDSGLDIKLSYDDYSNAYQCTAIGAWQSFHNAGIGVSARGLDIFDSFKILWFKVEQIAGWDLRQFVDKQSVRSRRG
jgi:hypothetical protein